MTRVLTDDTSSIETRGDGRSGGVGDGRVLGLGNEGVDRVTGGGTRVNSKSHTFLAAKIRKVLLAHLLSRHRKAKDLLVSLHAVEPKRG